MKKKPCAFCSKVVDVKGDYVPKWICKCGCYEYPVNPITCTDCELKIQQHNVAARTRTVSDTYREGANKMESLNEEIVVELKSLAENAMLFIDEESREVIGSLCEYWLSKQTE